MARRFWIGVVAGVLMVGPAAVWAADVTVTAPVPGGAAAQAPVPLQPVAVAPVVVAPVVVPPAPQAVAPETPAVPVPAADVAPVPAPLPAPVDVSAPALAPVTAPVPAPSQSGPQAKPPGPAANGLGSNQPFNGQLQCNGCTPVSAPFMRRGQAILKYMSDHDGELPHDLVQLKSLEIDSLLRGMSWTSAVLTGKDIEEPYQRLLAFDADGRGRWLNFLGGFRGYSTLCQYQVDEDMLCLSCSAAPAQCSALYHDTKTKDLIFAFDPEHGQIEIYDWIMKSRWESDRFLAPH